MKTSTRQTIGYLAAYFMLGAVIASLGPTLPGLAANTGIAIASIGIVFSARSLGYLFGSLLGGALYDRLRGNDVLAAAALLSALALWTIPLIAVFVVLATVLFLIGFFQGATDVGCNMQLSRVHGSRVGPYLNAMFFLAGVGSFLTPLLIGALTLEQGYRLLAIALLPVAVWQLFTPSPAIEKHDHGNGDSAPLGILLLFAFLAFIYIGTEVSYGGWIFTYFQASDLGDEAAGYRLNSLFYLAITFGRLLAIPLAARFAARRILWIYISGAVFGVMLMLLLPAQTWSIWAGTAILGLSIAAIFPTTFSYVGKITKFSGRQTGTVWAIGSAGAMLVPWVIGKVMGGIAPLGMMGILLVLWLAAFGLFWGLTRASRACTKAG